jgi:hypothetical protein
MTDCATLRAKVDKLLGETARLPSLPPPEA